MKYIILQALLLSATFGYSQQGQILIVIEEVETAKVINVNPTSPSETEIPDEGTNNPESTGATRYEVNGKEIYLKELPLIRIEQTNKVD